MTTWWPPLPTPQDADTLAIDPGDLVTPVDHFDLGHRGGHTAAVTVAAADTPADLRRLAEQKFQCDGTADHIEIQDAINSIASFGGQVILLPGNYYIDQSVQMVSNLVFQGSGQDTTTIHQTAASVNTDALTASGVSYVTIHSLAFRNANAGANTTAIYIHSASSNFTLHDLTISSAGEWDYAVSCASSSSIVVRNCAIKSIIAGVYATDVSNLTIEQSLFQQDTV